MPAGYTNLEIDQGTTFSTQLVLDDRNGIPLDLTNFTIRSQARKSYYAANSVIEFDTSISDTSNGVIQLALSSANTSNIPAGKLVYDVIITDTGSGTVTRVLEGQIFVSPAVTR